MNGRYKLCREFRENSIPHSKIIYKEGLDLLEQSYDAFICGSDQIWNPVAVKPVYLLEFVKTKPKFSYAASIAVNNLKESERRTFAKALNSFSRISVREQTGKDILKDVIKHEIEVVADPTLLLPKEDWDKTPTCRTS